MNKLAEGLKPAKTEATTQWAVNNFTKWAANRCALVPDDSVPSDLLVCHDPAIVSKYLCMLESPFMQTILGKKAAKIDFELFQMNFNGVHQF